MLLAVLGVSLSALAADVAQLRNGFSIRHERSAAAGEKTRLFLSAAPGAGYVEVPTSEINRIEHEEYVTPVAAGSGPGAGPKAVDVRELADAAARQHQLDADFIESVIRAESGGNPRARSRKGAQGLMQLLPGTARRLGVADSYDPAANVDAGTRYLRQLLDQYDGDAVKALAAYNAGPHRVAQYNGVPPYRETRGYVNRIIRDYNRKKLAQQRAATKQKAQKKTVAAAPAPTSGN